MDEFDRALDHLKFHLKKEIIDNYFAERNYLEEDLELLQDKESGYNQTLNQVVTIFAALYHLLKSPELIRRVVQMWHLPEPPFWEASKQVSPVERERVLRRFAEHGWTKRGRFRNKVFDLYDYLYKAVKELQENQASLSRHCQLYNEDVKKFNVNFDFSLISTQIESLEGEQTTMPGGLSASDRDALQTRMALPLRRLTACHSESIVPLPPLAAIKKQFAKLLEHVP